MECSFPTITAGKEEMKTIFETVQTIAIIGLSPDESKDSHRVAAYLQKKGYKIIPVYPKEEMILGEKVYRSLADIKEPVDMVNIFRKPEAMDFIVDEAIKRGDVRVVWSQIGIVNDEAARKAKENGMTVVQNRCLMVEHSSMKAGK